MTTPIIKKVYLSADALFDLRQGTLNYISSEFAAKVTSNKDYYLREQDLFQTEEMGALDPDIYKQVFEKYKDKIIRTSMTTKILIFISQLCNEFMKQAINTPFMSSIELDVNLYPFVFNDSETAILLKAMSHYLGRLFNINIIYLHPQQLTIATVKEKYVAMVMYEYSEWFNLHNEELIKNPLREVGFYVPKLYFLNKPTDEQLSEFKKHSTNPFDFTTRVTAPFALIQYLPIAMYSVNTPINLNEYSVILR